MFDPSTIESPNDLACNVRVSFDPSKSHQLPNWIKQLAQKVWDHLKIHTPNEWLIIKLCSTFEIHLNEHAQLAASSMCQCLRSILGPQLHKRDSAWPSVWSWATHRQIWVESLSLAVVQDDYTHEYLRQYIS